MNCLKQARTVSDMTSPTQLIPKRLTRRRIEAGLTQTELAKRAGCSKSLVSEVEAGKANFSITNLAAISRVLGCEIADLLPPEDETGTGA